jgi:hypothetical protein
LLVSLAMLGNIIQHWKSEVRVIYIFILCVCYRYMVLLVSLCVVYDNVDLY